MRRIIFAILAFYLAALAVLDTAAFNGRYRRAIWSEASYQGYRIQAEFNSVLARIGFGTVAVARP